MKSRNFRAKLSPQKLSTQKVSSKKSSAHKSSAHKSSPQTPTLSSPSSQLAEVASPLFDRPLLDQTLLERSLLGRRNFLGLGLLFSSSALIPQFLQALNHTLNPQKAEAVSFASPVEPAKPALSTTSQLLDQPGWSIGFYPKAHSKARSLISAKDLQHGDPKFLSLGAQVTIDRLYLPSKYPLQSLNISIDYQPTELVQTIKVCAWGYCANGLNRSPATSLFVPVKAGKGLTLTMDWLVAGSLEPGSIVHQLAVGSGQALPKLQRGYYVIAGRRQSTGDFPQWNTYHSIPHSEISDSSVLKHIDLRAKDASPIDFPYLLLSVDYGNSPTV